MKAYKSLGLVTMTSSGPWKVLSLLQLLQIKKKCWKMYHIGHYYNHFFYFYLIPDKNGTSTEFSSLNFVITDKNVTSEFKKIFENYYHGKYFNIDNKKSNLFSVVVNGWAQDESNGRIKSIVSSGNYHYHHHPHPHHHPS